ncbi:MAG: hypothetical protein ACFBWO_12850 [Paracoccaceae bacterium]
MTDTAATPVVAAPVAGLVALAARLAPSRVEIAALAAGGAAGLVAWEVFARVLTPLVIGGPLEPAALIVTLFQSTIGVHPGLPAAEALHYATGILGYPLAYWALSRGRSLGVGLDGLVWGVITWVLALGLFAGLAGLPFMLGWIALTWMSLFGHVIYAQLAVAVHADLTGSERFRRRIGGRG